MSRITRRETLAGMGVWGTAAFTNHSLAQSTQSPGSAAAGDRFQELYRRVNQTLLVDTHEHL